MPKALWCVTNGLALAPPARVCIIGVSTSRNLLLVEVLTEKRNDLRPLPEQVAGLVAHDQVEVSLTIARLDIGQAMELLGQRAQGFHQQPQGVGRDAEFPGAGLSHHTPGEDDIADVPGFERCIGVLSDDVALHQQLNIPEHAA